jgi:hypothetical protein
MIKKFLCIVIGLLLAVCFFCVPVLAATANPTSSTVLVNGKNVAFDAYNINDNNFFKLRDLAFTLNGTSKQFEIGYYKSTTAITLTSGNPYTPVGGEMEGKGAGSKEAVPTTSKIFKDGKEVQFTAYYIGGNNYFKLRDIGEVFNFGVEWDEAAQTIRIDTNKEYTQAATTTPPPPSGDIDPKLVGMWSNSSSDYYIFYDDGTFVFQDIYGFVGDGLYSTSGGRVYFTQISYYKVTLDGGRTETKARVDVVSDYEFFTSNDDEYVKIYKISRSYTTTDIKRDEISLDEFFSVSGC